MLRYLLNRITGESEGHRNERVKEENVQDFIKYKKRMCHGFPQKACTLAVDSDLGLLAIGSKEGDLIIAGSENSQWSTSFGHSTCISSVSFIPNTFTLISITENGPEQLQNIHKITLENGLLKLETMSPVPGLKRICSHAVVAAENGPPYFLLGTISGNLYQLNTATMTTTDLVVFEDLVGIENLEEYPQSKRSISFLSSSVADSRYLSIVIEQSLLIIFDLVNLTVVYRIKPESKINCVAFSHPLNSKLVIGHVEGCFSKYRVRYSPEFALDVIEQDTFFYGQSKSLPVTNIDYYVSDTADILLYSGGLPSATFGDRNGVTVKSPDKHLILDYDSSILSFSLFNQQTEPVLFILCEQELSAVDLVHPDFKVFNLPYLYSMHFSPISSAQLVSNVNEHMFTRLQILGEQQQSSNSQFTERNWPLSCEKTADNKHDKLKNKQHTDRSILITGHENGAIVFWRAGVSNLKPLLIYQTCQEFEGFSQPSAPDIDDEFLDVEEPPFRRSGIFEAFCDDPRLAIEKIIFNEKTGTVAVGGRAGHVFVYELSDKAEEHEPLTVIEADMVGAAQKSTDKNGRITEVSLPLRRSRFKYPCGLLPLHLSMVQLKPPVAVQTLAWNPSNNLIAVGIEFGYVVCELERRQIVCKVSLVPADEIVEIVNNDGQLSRFKSMKKTIRQSFRRKRRTPAERSENGAAGVIQDLRPLEREIVARPRSNVSTSTLIGGSGSVKMIKFAHAAVGEDPATDLLLVGTSGSVLHIHKASVSDRCKKLREIRLKHQASVLHAEVSRNMLVIYTEEQIRCFSLPSLKPARYKYRLTALEGSRIFNVHSLQLFNVKDPNSCEQFIAVLTNRGEIFVFSPGISKLLTKVTFTQPTDGVGIKSAVMSADGTLFWQKSGGSQYQSSTLSAINPLP